MVPEKQFPETGRINLGDAGEIQYDVVAARFFRRQQNQDLDAGKCPTTKLSSEGEDFRLKMASFMYLKHGAYLRVRKEVW